MKTLARHSLWLFLARLGTQAGMALFTVLLARQLGSAGFGQYAFMAALIVIGNALTTFGTDMLLIREIAAHADLSMLPAALALQIALSILFVAGVFLLPPIFPPVEFDGITALRIYSLSLFPLAFFTVFTTALRGKQQMGSYTLLNLSLAGMQVAVACALLLRGGDLLMLASLLLLVQVVAAVLAGIFCGFRIPNFLQNWQFSTDKVFQLIQAGARMALLGGTGILYQRLSLTMLPFLVTTSETGIFSAAARLVEAAKFGHIAVFTAVYPIMAERKPQTPGWLNTFRLPWGMLIFAATVAALTLSLLAKPLVMILFGAEYGGSASILKILSWVLVPYTFNTFHSLALLAEGREFTVFSASAASLLGLGITTVWWGQIGGAIGAAWAVVAMEILQSVILVFARGQMLSVVKNGGVNEFPNLP